MDSNLTQGCVAKMIGCTEASLYAWENNRANPIISFFPKIIKFLGYVPFYTKEKSIGEKIKLYRKLTGQSVRKLEKITGHDQATLSGWENGRGKPCKKLIDKIHLFLNSYT